MESERDRDPQGDGGGAAEWRCSQRGGGFGEGGKKEKKVREVWKESVQVPLSLPGEVRQRFGAPFAFSPLLGKGTKVAVWNSAPLAPRSLSPAAANALPRLGSGPGTASGVRGRAALRAPCGTAGGGGRGARGVQVAPAEGGGQGARLAAMPRGLQPAGGSPRCGRLDCGRGVLRRAGPGRRVSARG